MRYWYLAVRDQDFANNGVRKLKNLRYEKVGREDWNKTEDVEKRKKWRTDVEE